MSPHSATAWPNIHATINDDGSAHLTTNGLTQVFPPAEAEDTRNAVLAAVTETAQELNRSVRLHTDGNDGQWVLIVTPGGEITTESEPPAQRRPTPEATSAVQDKEPTLEDTSSAQAMSHPISQLRLNAQDPHRLRPINAPNPFATKPAPPTAATKEVPAVPRRRAEVGTLLTATPTQEPAQNGWRGFLSRMGFKMQPSPAEVGRRSDVRATSQHWPGLRTIAIANPKGGANKTPTTLMLAAMFARQGGSGVVAWDNNETRGTLGWRSEQGPHNSTVLDLLPHVEELLDPAARAGDMARFLHHQPADRYDVLRSDDAVESDHEIDADEVDALHQVLGKYYRLVFIDTGNSERANNWRAAMSRADQLVVPMVGREDTAEAAALMLDALHARDEASQRLAQNAIAIISQQTPTDQIDWIVERFAPLVKEVVTIPHDPALKAGVIRFDALNQKTQRAWLHAAAAVARNL